MKVENIEVTGWKASVRGMRNPMNSWNRSDSDFSEDAIRIGSNDLNLMQKLFHAGSEHRKFARMLNVTMDITASHVFWQEFDTYKIGTVRNSCSKMHKIHLKPFTLDDFAHSGIMKTPNGETALLNWIDYLELLRTTYNETGEKRFWEALLEALPMGYQIRATVQMNYENAWNMWKQRRNHKWYEWHTLCDAFEKLPYFCEITGAGKKAKDNG